MKVTGPDQDRAFLGATLQAILRKYQWSAPKQVTVEIATGTQIEVKNFNSLDEFGLLLDLPRLPAEHNVDYKNRLLSFVNPDLKTNSTYRGLLNGISNQLGLPIDTAALTITANASEEQPEQKIVTNLETWVYEGTLFFTASEFLKAGEEAVMDANYPRLTVSKIIARILSIAQEDENVVSEGMYSVPEHGQWIDIDPSLMGKSLRVTYQYAETMNLSGASLRDVVLFLNSITMSPQAVVLAELASEFNPEVYTSTGSVSNDYFVEDWMNTSLYHLPNPLYLVMGDEERAVSSISNDHIFYEGDLLPNTASGDFTLTVSPPATFFPVTRFSGVSEIEIPLYHVRLEKVDKTMLTKWANVYEGSVADATEMVKMIRDLMHVTWDEQVLDYDIWNAIEGLLMSNSEIPALYDMPKQAFRVGTTNELVNPEVNRYYGGVSNDHVLREEFFTSNDLQSGVGSVDVDSTLASPDDLKLVELVDVSNEWRPKLQTGFFHIGDRTYYLYDQKVTKWLDDVTWYKIPLPTVLSLAGKTVSVPAVAAQVTYTPTGYLLADQFVKIRNMEVWVNLAFLNPTGSAEYNPLLINQYVSLSFAFEDLSDQDIVTRWSPGASFFIPSLEKAYLLEPAPTAGAPVVLTDVSGDLLWSYDQKHPQFSVEEGELKFLDTRLTHSIALLEWEAGSGDYHISDEVDYNPVNNPEASGFLGIENVQRAPIGEAFLGPGGILC